MEGCGYGRWPYRCLDHLHPLSPHLPDGTSYVHNPLLPYLLQDCVYCNQCSSTPHTSTVGSQGHHGTPPHTHLPPPPTHLQWINRGPLPPSCWVLTFLWKARREVAYSGTPWSGQPVKWNWVTFLGGASDSWGR